METLNFWVLVVLSLSSKRSHLWLLLHSRDVCIHAARAQIGFVACIVSGSSVASQLLLLDHFTKNAIVIRILNRLVHLRKHFILSDSAEFTAAILV